MLKVEGEEREEGNLRNLRKYQDRASHIHFFESRNWTIVSEFWRKILSLREMPSFVNGYEQYGVSDLAAIHAVGLMEFQSGDPRFKRQTFALRIGYDGSHYNGYQMQKGIDGVVTVEDDIESALGRKVVAAGRTDKDVSAVSQMISFSTFDNISADDILNQFRNSEASKSGFLAVYDCKRVPKRFHALFSATWRRYLYVFPLNSGSFDGVDVDCPFVNSCLNKYYQNNRLSI